MKISWIRRKNSTFQHFQFLVIFDQGGILRINKLILAPVCLSKWLACKKPSHIYFWNQGKSLIFHVCISYFSHSMIQRNFVVGYYMNPDFAFNWSWRKNFFTSAGISSRLSRSRVSEKAFKRISNLHCQAWHWSQITPHYTSAHQHFRVP